MCDCEPTRREAIGKFVAVGAALVVGQAVSSQSVSTAQAAPPAVPAVEVMPGLSIYPRNAWGADLAPKGPIYPEKPQFLLVHHTESPNNYTNARDVIRSVYSFHTSSEKRWNDVCYQFFVGRDGDVWEGRAGALGSPVQADATGGSQGFAQLVCLLGSFTSVAPTAAALTATAKLLAWLTDAYRMDTSPGATTTFVSRGSNKFRAGTVVTTPIVAGHRDMTYTDCPGDAFYALLPQLRSRVIAEREAWNGVMRPARRMGTVQL
ncbi:MAG: N-acetylmuramoyl-L-alanine amidase [Ilumatobacteraceae bacterium]|nr:N-acetylmuramoyl-L-alanine amidase [Ilumatobacteraceae bacterium]